MLERIERQVRILGGDQKAVVLLDCGLLHNAETGDYSLDLRFENHSGKTLAALTVYIAGYDAAGREIGRDVLQYTFEKDWRGRYGVFCNKGLQLPVERMHRMTVQIWRAYVYRRGGRGERIEV